MGIPLGEQAVQIIIKHILYEVNVLDGPDHDDTAHPSFNFGVKRAFEFSQRALWARWHARFHCHRHVISAAAGIAVSSEGSVCLLALLLAKDAAT